MSISIRFTQIKLDAFHSFYVELLLQNLICFNCFTCCVASRLIVECVCLKYVFLFVWFAPTRACVLCCWLIFVAFVLLQMTLFPSRRNLLGSDTACDATTQFQSPIWHMSADGTLVFKKTIIRYCRECKLLIKCVLQLYQTISNCV